MHFYKLKSEAQASRSKILFCHKDKSVKGTVRWRHLTKSKRLNEKRPSTKLPCTSYFPNNGTGYQATSQPTATVQTVQWQKHYQCAPTNLQAIHHQGMHSSSMTQRKAKRVLEIYPWMIAQVKTVWRSPESYLERKHASALSIKIEHISTKDQIADQFTKPLERIKFQELRKRLLGW